MRHTRNSGEAVRGPSVGPAPARISVSMRNALLLRRPRGAGPVAQWLELAAHNRLVGGSSPPGPTTHSRSNGDFPVWWETGRIGGLVGCGRVSVGRPLW